MRTRAAALVVVIALVAVAAVGVVGILTRKSAPPPNKVQIQMRSDPFPSAVGPETLHISLVNSDGSLVKDAAVQVTANMMMEGMLPIAGRPISSQDGQYHFDVMWPMAGEWTLDVTAALPGQSSTTQESFDIFVYPVPIQNPGGETTYRSASEVNAEVSANPAREYWIVIPQGTQALQRSGQGEDLIPAEIHLRLDAQNILVIRNDDVADHEVGPFFVRAGETLRQEFTRAATFVGKCTLRHGDEVSLVVE